ncbi:MAG TPA: hypothetical protein VE046_01660 [Steroidobacteraceae bacterium]|nr:hypothetical protein [Steroidobacteraceae bacterium]
MYRQTVFVILAVAGVLALDACGKQADAPAPQSAANAAPADAGQDAALAAKEQELAQREKDVADREAALAAQKAEEEKAAAAPAPAPVKKPAAPVKKPVVAASAPAKPAPPKPSPVVVPAGTQLTVALLSELSSKTAKAGDTFSARLVSDVMVNGRLAAPAGSHVTGAVTDVISGSKKIGGTPTIGLRFDTLVLESGQEIAIDGELVESGKSDTGRDTAKIVGGTAVGAIIGHQIKSGSGGKIVGGLLGGAIGAAIAKNTGTEVVLPVDSQLTISLSKPIEIKPH